MASSSAKRVKSIALVCRTSARFKAQIASKSARTAGRVTMLGKLRPAKLEYPSLQKYATTAGTTKINRKIGTAPVSEYVAFATPTHIFAAECARHRATKAPVTA